MTYLIMVLVKSDSHICDVVAFLFPARHAQSFILESSHSSFSQKPETHKFTMWPVQTLYMFQGMKGFFVTLQMACQGSRAKHLVADNFKVVIV